MAKVNWKGATLLYPVPAILVSTGTMEKSNILTVAWCGIIPTLQEHIFLFALSDIPMKF